MKDFSHLYGDEYFDFRFNNDPKRAISFKQEKQFLETYLTLRGNVCDVGCSTGEFLHSLSWEGEKYGIEINLKAIESARNVGISFDKSILNQTEYFDLVIFRGTIQHLPAPFEYIDSAFKALKKGGHIAFLATPNSRSIVYKLFNHLPALHPDYNFYIPSDRTLISICKNYGFKKVAIDYPYITSPYSSILSDHIRFIRSLLLRTEPDFAFWGSMMNVILIKE